VALLALHIVRIKSLSVAIALAMIAVFGGCKPERDADSVSGTIEVDDARVASRYGGRVKEIFAQEGQSLVTGQTIIALEAGPRKEDIAVAKADWEAQVTQLELARADWKRTDDLFAKKVISETERDRMLANATALEKSVAAAKSRYDLLLAGTRNERLAQIRAQLAELDAHLAEMKIVAPTNCVLEVLSVKPGDVLSPNQPIATLLLTNHIWVRVFVPEPWLGHIKLGDAVKVRVDAFSGKDFAGVVEQVAREAEFTPRNVQTVGERVKQVFGVKVKLDNTEGQLRAGMAADVSFPGVPK
jgi:multidrug resistance efflux pump